MVPGRCLETRELITLTQAGFLIWERVLSALFLVQPIPKFLSLLVARFFSKKTTVEYTPAAWWDASYMVVMAPGRRARSRFWALELVHIRTVQHTSIRSHGKVLFYTSTRFAACVRWRY